MVWRGVCYWSPCIVDAEATIRLQNAKYKCVPLCISFLTSLFLILSFQCETMTVTFGLVFALLVGLAASKVSSKNNYRFDCPDGYETAFGLPSERTATMKVAGTVSIMGCCQIGYRFFWVNDVGGFCCPKSLSGARVILQHVTNCVEKPVLAPTWVKV